MMAERLLFYRQVEGMEPGTGACTTQIELSSDSRFLLIRLASTAKFTLALDRDSTLQLLTTLRTGQVCAVPGEHTQHGRRLLGARPPDSERESDRAIKARTMELYLRLPDDEIHVAFAGPDLLDLITHLEDGYTRLPGTPDDPDTLESPMRRDRRVDVVADVIVNGDVRLGYELDPFRDQLHLSIGSHGDLNLAINRQCLPHWIAVLTEARAALDHAVAELNRTKPRPPEAS
ncbi:hypothetical protein GCM10012275_08800 [Longimycelium tulufanense]|uniref:Uncharacterized protein n=1 Tax=Longimycelium tulufanense TaxID=907463 RepID=A0A8J3CAQ7_9PSEU|nr:hypothetical protein [Longimycelium tulufanense]GGM40075.1 hypothetical protein GCM10012275_08800 [Longimycelium tulufanense]